MVPSSVEDCEATPRYSTLPSRAKPQVRLRNDDSRRVGMRQALPHTKLFLLPLADDAVRRPSLLPCRVARARDAQSEQQRGSDRSGGQRHSGQTRTVTLVVHAAACGRFDSYTENAEG